MTEFSLIIKELIKFRDQRDWSQFHDTKNLATAIAIEASELNELFLWKTIKESDAVEKSKIADELADIFSYCLLLAARHELDVEQIILDKIKRNEERYPIDKAKGNATKYTDL